MFQKPAQSAGFVRLTGHHDPLIEGLRHGGVAEKIRHATTNFGSGLRGFEQAARSQGVSILPSQIFGLWSKGDAFSAGSGGLDQRLYSFIFSRNQAITQASYTRLTKLAAQGAPLTAARLGQGIERVRQLQTQKQGISLFGFAYKSARNSHRW